MTQFTTSVQQGQAGKYISIINVYTYDYFDYYEFTLKKPSMGRAVMYYGMVFVENYVMISIWYILAEHNEVHVATAQLIWHNSIFSILSTFIHLFSQSA